MLTFLHKKGSEWVFALPGTVYFDVASYFPWLCWSSCVELNNSRNKITKYTSSEVLITTLGGGLRLKPVSSHTTLDCI